MISEVSLKYLLYKVYKITGSRMVWDLDPFQFLQSRLKGGLFIRFDAIHVD